MSDKAAPEPFSPPSPPIGQDFGMRVAAFYGALFLIYGVHVPYLPLWLDWRGIDARGIGIIMAAPFFLRLAVTPLVALAADRHAIHRRAVIAMAWGAVALVAGLSQAQGFWAIFFLAVPFHVAAATIMPLTETIAVRGVRQSGLDYGRMRLWGSLTFIAIGLAGGALADAYGASTAIYVIAAGALVTAVCSHWLPPDPPAEPGDMADRPALAIGASFKLLGTRSFLLFLFAVALVQASHGTFYSFGALHWKAQGYSTAWVGALWAIAVLAEVVLFAIATRVFKAIGPVDLIAAGAAAALVRWGVMSLDPPLWILAPLQALHALTYAASHLGAMQFIAKSVPVSAAGTAQALYAVMASGVVMGAVTLASGELYESAGGFVYVLPAALGGLGLCAALVLRSWERA